MVFSVREIEALRLLGWCQYIRPAQLLRVVSEAELSNLLAMKLIKYHGKSEALILTAEGRRLLVGSAWLPDTPRTYHADAIVRRLRLASLLLTAYQSGKIKQMKLRSKEDWCVVEKNHAPIISEELFTSVQHLLSLDTRTSPSEDVVQPLAGMLFCADCGRAMCRRSVKRGNRTFYYYVCSTHKRSKLCSSHSISQTALEEVVLRAIQKQIEMVVDIDQLIHEIGQKSIQAAKHRQLDMSIEEKEKQITEQKEYRMRLLEAFHDDLISRTEYDMMRQRYTQRIDALQVALASLHERRQALEEGAADTRNWVAEYIKFRKIDKLTREMVAGLIRRITVSEGKQITIQFNYADELASYQQMIAAAAKEVG